MISGQAGFWECLTEPTRRWGEMNYLMATAFTSLNVVWP